MIQTPTAGVALKAQHYADAMVAPAAGLWFEVHAENYMVDGGPRLAMLEAVRDAYPLSLHGVGLSLASAERPDPAHLEGFARLVDRFEPFLVSEHLAWSRLGRRYLPDLLPFPRTHEALTLICRNIDIVQARISRRLLIENPSHYLAVEGHRISEQAFLEAICSRTGCGLLLDLHNVAVSAHNLQFDAMAYLADFPAELVGEIHLAGGMADAGLDVLIDSHSAPVPESVWALHDAFVRRHGPRPTLLEWDRDLPGFDRLMRERDRAAAQMGEDVDA